MTRYGIWQEQKKQENRKILYCEWSKMTMMGHNHPAAECALLDVIRPNSLQ
jgi:hypothetical protein